MASKIYCATSLTGGSAGSLDSIKTATISDGDMALVIVNGTEEFYVYTFDSGNIAAESSPDVINPNDKTGTEAWVLVDMTMGDITVRGTGAITGNVNFTGNVDVDGNLSFDGSATVVDTILDEDNMASNDVNALATQQSIKAYVDSAVGGVAVDVDLLAGFISRSRFTWSDTDTITIGAGRYHLLGTAQGENIYKWDSAITYDFGSGGSNANSSDLGASEWHYLYIDDSSLSDSTTALVAANFLNSTTAPIWDASEHGWYNGADRCIGAFYSNSLSQLPRFYHDGKDQIMWGQTVTVFSSLTSSYAAKTFRAPALACNQRVQATIRGGNNHATVYYQQTDGSASQWVMEYRYDTSGDNQGRPQTNVRIYYIDSSQQANFKSDSSDTIYCYQDSYFLPEGM
jgi:hypothetical protein